MKSGLRDFHSNRDVTMYIRLRSMIECSSITSTQMDSHKRKMTRTSWSCMVSAAGAGQG